MGMGVGGGGGGGGPDGIIVWVIFIWGDISREGGGRVNCPGGRGGMCPDRLIVMTYVHCAICQ